MSGMGQTATAPAPLQRLIEDALQQSLNIEDERGLDVLWTEASEQVRRYALRPAKRLRPSLVVAGYRLARQGREVPAGVWRFAAGLELLHTFLLIHDDVADRAELRRGGPALHRVLAPGKLGEDLSIIMGDHLFARALELMLGAGVPRASEVTQWFLSVCRQTAVGQFLDLQLSSRPLGEVTLFQALKVAHLKTARYGFVAPLVCGAQLAGASPELIEALERAGRHAGLAFQLRDDLIGMFGDPNVSGKSADGDIAEGKRTFPVIAAYVRATEEGREELEALWSDTRAPRNEDTVLRARALIERFGGRAATQRAIDRHTRTATRALEQLPQGEVTDSLKSLIHQLARRAA